jgi:outer membrane protein insertion porin family
LTGKRLSIAIWVEEGTKYRFGKLGIGGYTIYDSAAVWEKLKFKQGEIFSTEKLDESMSEIYFLFQEKGYIYAQVEDDRRVEGDSVNLNLSITEGKEAHIRKIEIVGNSRTFDKVIRREMAIYPGNTFVRSKLMRSVRNIYYLNYFGDVIPDFKVLENGDVDLVIAVEEKPIGKFQIGATYNSRDKLVGNISVGWPNVLGRGWETEFTWEFGKLRTNFSISFTEPWFLDVPTSVGFDIYSSELQSTGYYTELRQGASVRLGRRLSWPDDYFSLYWRYKLEQLKYYDFSSTYTPTTSYDLRTMSWPRIESGTTVTLGRDSRDSQMFATKGSKNLYALEVAGDYIGGDVAFQKQDFRSDWYFPLHKYLTFVIKGRAGYLTNAFGDDPEYVPYGERFFFGNFSNDGQIRGYQDRAISPIDTSDAIFDSNSTPDIAGNYPMTTPQQTFQIGGRVMGILTAELRVPIVRDQLYFSVFGDVGNMWRDAESIDFSLLKKGAGVGIRIVVPMLGVMGLDVGYGFDTDDRTAKKSGLQWHFQIGTE